ncbi:hypothetical protein [Mycetocola spongiae]|uniref:hypothetical protein n=1 Tax=Mycetocola spongiae TaxID=2859226 RepID=UPI001CF5AF3A|nr:hypothetical protein [Mycetocola spongiae]UCR89928.1 hypothetical protein KXZ72_04460 [Mycetocola spongiae]
MSAPAPEHVGRKTPEQIRASKRGTLIQALAGAVLGVATLPVMYFVLLWGYLDEAFGILFLVPVIPVVTFWGLDAFMNETRWSLLRGLIAGVCVTLGILVVFQLRVNLMNLIFVGAFGGIIGVLLSRVRDLVRRPSSGL